MRRNGKCIAILLAVILAALGVVLPSEAAEEPQIVYVAGASDSFPIEFYDRQEHRYKGMLPLLLERMNGQGQYQFIYLHPGSMDRREELAKNTQVDMYTGFDMKNAAGERAGNIFWEASSETEKNVFYCYTDSANQELIRYVENYIAGMTEEDIRILAMEGSSEPPKTPWTEDMAKVILGAGMAGLLFCAVLLTVKVKKEKEIARAYRFQDTMTGFGSIDKWRVVFKQLVHDENRSKYCVAYMDLDLKSIFKTYGFEETAQMLEYVSEVLEDCLGQDSAFARFYEVGFVILLPYYSMQQLQTKLEALKEHIAQMVREKEKEYILTPYFGVYLLKQDDKSMEQPIYYAETTSEYARDNDQLFAVYNRNVKALTIDSYELERDAVRALMQEKLEMYIQPVIRLADGAIAGGETFVRWEHPGRGFLHADVFLPVFKRNRMMGQLDLYIFDRACRFQKARMERGEEPVNLRCNFSVENLFQQHFADGLIRKLREYGISGRNFAIQIVRVNLFEVNNSQRKYIKETISRLKSHGFDIYMGELNMNDVFEDIHETGISQLVINRELIRDLRSSSRTVVESIVDMGHRIGTKVIAEGVETEEQKEFLKKVGCDFAQGFYFYQAISVEEFNELLKSRANHV